MGEGRALGIGVQGTQIQLYKQVQMKKLLKLKSNQQSFSRNSVISEEEEEEEKEEEEKNHVSMNTCTFCYSKTMFR